MDTMNPINVIEDISNLIGEEGSEITVNDQQIRPGLGLNNSAHLLAESVARFREGILQVAVMGTACRGKTTLMNALVGEELLPSDPEINSGAIVKVVHGQNTDEATLVEEGIPRTVSRSDFVDAITIKPEDMGSILAEEPFPLSEELTRIDYGILPHDHPLSRRGIILIDTLGFNAGLKAAQVTKDFLSRADAVIVVLGSHPPFTDADINIIRSQLEGFDISKIENVYFILNNFGLSSEEVARIEKTLPVRLTPFFSADESLFSRRVFTIDAKAALEAKISGEAGQVLEATGLPAFEQALHQTMDTAERERLILQGTMAKVVIPAVNEAEIRIAESKAFLSGELETLQEREEVHAEALAALRKKAADIQVLFDEHIGQLGDKAATYFRAFVEASLGKWSDHWEKIREELEISLVSIVAATVSPAKKEALQKRIEKVVERYLSSVLESWPKALTEHIKSDIDDLSVELEVEIDNFTIALEQVTPTLDGDAVYDPQEGRLRKVSQILIGIFTLDLNQIVGPLLSDKWISTLRRMISHFVMDFLPAMLAGTVASFFVGGPAGPLVFASILVAEFIVMYWRDRSLFDSRIRDNIGAKITEIFDKQMPELQHRIRNEFEKRFKPIGDRLFNALENEIRSAESQWRSASEKLHSGEEAVAAEKTRLDIIQTLLTERFEMLSQYVFGRELTPEEQRELFESPSLDKEQPV